MTKRVITDAIVKSSLDIVADFTPKRVRELSAALMAVSMSIEPETSGFLYTVEINGARYEVTVQAVGVAEPEE